MDKKIVLIISLFTLAVFAVAIFAFSSGENKAVVEKTIGAKILVDHQLKKVGDIPYDGGDLIHAFPIKNTGSKDLEIANIATSCMCTKAYLKVGNTKSEEFGMKGMIAPSSWKGIIKAGQTAEIIADFDPKYHGPQGVGPVARIISFETNDPDHPYVEVSLEGVVIK